ncbi:Zn-dependent hydrolase [Halolactibacillus alkaliphilus]|uniref:Zn-dependent hydrolase n=1 Tax=Halolactibacillus alkaliphilus TaxID=442899 RepID=A0A511X0K3_9BACI|nr:Zn-dependent hydrolase [Halolactibacillus alkaliphilus]GEN56451.1 Zn-dependent hydrolase [Halolactibacillus alkaliphilus]GGN64376.1 Zn-dependent hydrolase [Halolactibacillus alkaliphilus]SFO61217.1 allantoate deiminase [Halolactibacillus alkaliphilus]
MLSLERMMKDIHTLATYTSKTPGVTRLSYTNEERAAKAYLIKEARQYHLDVSEDAIGNLFMRYRSNNKDAKILLIGSHIDSVKGGGKYDGTLGVVIGLEVLRHLSEINDTLPFHVDVVSFTDEEGARFKTGMIGSRALTGSFFEEELSYVDEASMSLNQARKEATNQPLDLKNVQVDPSQLVGYLEVHIEQGKVLEKRGLPVGLVNGIVGLNWYEVEIEGEAGHAGATPMDDRKDPVIAGSVFMLKLYNEVKDNTQAVVTFGQMHIEPGSINVIPSKTTFSIDLRDIEQAELDRLDQHIHELAKDIEVDFGVSLTITKLDEAKPVNMSEMMMSCMETAIKGKGYPVHILSSGAGHDAMHMANITPTGLLFLRTPNGVSHRPDETVIPEDVLVAADILLDTVLALRDQQDGMMTRKK